MAHIHVDNITQQFTIVLYTNGKKILRILVMGIPILSFAQLISYGLGNDDDLSYRDLITFIKIIFSIHLLPMGKSHTLFAK